MYKNVQTLHVYKLPKNGKKELVVSFILFENIKVAVKKTNHGIDDGEPLSLREFKDITQKWTGAVQDGVVKGVTLGGSLVSREAKKCEERFQDLMEEGRIEVIG